VRIAIIAPPWAPVPPALYGGIEQAVDGEARGLAKAGHDVLLFTTGDSTCPVPRRWLLEEAEGERMGVTVPELRHVIAAYDAVRDFDLVHDHTVLGPVYARANTDLPVATTVHGPFNEDLSDIYRRVARGASLIAISEAQRTPAPDIPVARVIHHGVDAADFPYGDGAGGYVLFLGRMSPDKGAHRAVRAAQKAGVPLLLAGKCREPWERSYFSQEVAPHLGDDVRYVGEVPHDEKLQLLAGARATLFPIRWNEPFGLVMIESLACGTPVLAFPEGAAVEVVQDGHTGYLCRDEKHMAEAIDTIESLSRADCRAAVEGYFSRERMIRDHVELFEALVAAH
jgi:glycosyltransferase involved in cell wall biosynthesis